MMKFFNISEKYDLYLYLTDNQSFELNELSMKNENIYFQKKTLIKLSIIIICNNHKKIVKLINSIISQKYGLFEIILIYDDEDKENYYLFNGLKSKLFFSK